MKKTTKKRTVTLTASQIRELTETIVGQALNVQARELEGHMNSIHERLVALEREVSSTRTR